MADEIERPDPEPRGLSALEHIDAARELLNAARGMPFDFKSVQHDAVLEHLLEAIARIEGDIRSGKWSR